MDPMNRPTHQRAQRLAVAATILLPVACSSFEDSRCDDVAEVDSVFYESGITVADSVGARFVFEEYVALVKASGHLFPDGAEDWLLDEVYPSQWDVAPWIVSFFPEPGDPFRSEVHVDRDGRLVRLVIAVHAPCAPLHRLLPVEPQARQPRIALHY